MKTRKRNVLTGTLLLFGLPLLLQGCGGSEDDTSPDEQSTDDSDNQQEAWLERAETPAGDFVPEDIEGVLDDIVDALNQTDQQSEMKLSVITKDNGEYFSTAALGANRAISELGVIGTVTAPESVDDPDLALQEELDLAQECVDGGYSGMTIAPLQTELSVPIDAAVDNGAVVVTFDSDLPDSKRQFYAGTNNTEAGKTAGQSLVTLLDGAVGTVVILGQEEDVWPDGYNRTMGAKDVIEAAGNTVIIRQADWADQPSNTAFMTEALQTADPSPVGLLGVFSNAYLCAEAAEDAGVIDSVKIAAFDFEADTLAYMEEGKIQVTHAQRQYYMGYLGPYIMYASQVLGIDATKELVADISVSDGVIDTGLDVIKADQIDAYNEFLDSLGILN
jgi:ribose transport system substrate-binding protein